MKSEGASKGGGRNEINSLIVLVAIYIETISVIAMNSISKIVQPPHGGNNHLPEHK